jgi:hypothetical protein
MLARKNQKIPIGMNAPIAAERQRRINPLRTCALPRHRVKPVRRAAGTDTTPRAWYPRIAIQVAAKFIVRRITRNEQMGDYIVAGPPSPFRFQPNDSRTVQFPAIFALRVDLVRSVRVDAQDSQLRRTHESAVKASRTPTPPAARALN